MQDLMETYRNSLYCVEFAGPTLFAPIITETCKLAQNSKAANDNNYYILLILTDGVIHDMDLTIQKIVAAAYLPLSIIIIGIGNEDFSNMIILDGDNGLVDRNGNFFH
jgi:hypothetical protein